MLRFGHGKRLSTVNHGHRLCSSGGGWGDGSAAEAMDSGRSAIGDGPVENGMNVVAAAIVAPCPWEGKLLAKKLGD